MSRRSIYKCGIQFYLVSLSHILCRRPHTPFQQVPNHTVHTEPVSFRYRYDTHTVHTVLKSTDLNVWPFRVVRTRRVHIVTFAFGAIYQIMQSHWTWQSPIPLPNARMSSMRRVAAESGSNKLSNMMG